MIVAPLSLDGAEDVFDDLLAQGIGRCVFTHPAVVALYRAGMLRPFDQAPLGVAGAQVFDRATAAGRRLVVLDFG